MPDLPDSNTSRDREIARYFAGMREADAQRAPAVATAEALARRRPLVPGRRYSPVLPRLAALIVLALVVALLTLDTSPRDPGVLYADIMGDNRLMTDTLLWVSPGSSPELIDTLGALDMDVSGMEPN